MASTRTRALSIMLVSGTLVLGASCSKGADTALSNAASPSTTAPGSVKAANGVSTGNGTAAGDSSTKGQASSVQVLSQSPEQVGRTVVSTATMTVKVDDVVAAKEKAKAGIDGLTGQLFNEQTSLAAKSTSTLTFKVKPERFNDALRDLSGLGKLASQEVKTEDVTQAAVDLDARIRAAEASTQRVAELVGRTGNVTELANLENEVQRRQAELESLRGQQRTLEARTELATVVLTLTTDDAPPAARTEEARALPGFFDGLRGGWTAFAGVATVAGAVIGALLPFAWIAVLAAVIVWLLRRRPRPVADA